MKPLYRERQQAVESRGWLMLGEQGGPCDKQCEHCTFARQPNLVFYRLATLMQHVNLYRHYYELDACDITGGEPTIYPEIVPLVEHCTAIGLRTTIITHGQNLREDYMLGNPRPLYQAIEAAGLDDWLVSLHGGSPASHDAILGDAGSFERLVRGLDLVQRPVRFTTTLMQGNYQDLPWKVLIDRLPTVWDIVPFTPFQVNGNEVDLQARYTEMAPHIERAVIEMESRGWEVNIRSWPLCIAEEHGFAENVAGYHQMSFDPWEWRLNAAARVPMQQVEGEGGWHQSERARATMLVTGRRNETCSSCRYRAICDKPPEQYQKKYGLDELHPVAGEVEHDPLVFQRKRAVPEVSR